MRNVSAMTLAALLITGLSVPARAAETAEARALVAVARGRVESTDSRAAGHLVRVDASGNRISNAFTVEAHWFPGVLRVLLEIVPSRFPASDARQNTVRDQRVSILFEMRPGGQNTIRIFHPHEMTPISLSFDKWGEGIVGSDFDYEDFLDAEYYWQGQAVLKSATIGSHECDVLRSTPGTQDRSHYASVQTWFDHTTGYPLYVEKTGKEPALVKQFTSLGLTQSDGVWAARQVEVKVEGRTGSTLLLFERGSAKAHLALKDFDPKQISKFEDHP